MATPDLPVAAGGLILSATINSLASSSAWYSTSSLSGSLFTVTFNGTSPNYYAITSLTPGQFITFLASANCPAGATLQVQTASGTLPVSGGYPITTSGNVAVVANQFQANDLVTVVFNGAHNSFELVGMPGTLPGAQVAGNYGDGSDGVGAISP